MSRKKPAGSKIEGTCFHCLVLSWIAAGVVSTVCVYKKEAGRRTDSGPSVIERREELRDGTGEGRELQTGVFSPFSDPRILLKSFKW